MAIGGGATEPMRSGQPLVEPDLDDESPQTSAFHGEGLVPIRNICSEV